MADECLAQVGEVLEESAKIALSWLRSHAHRIQPAQIMPTQAAAVENAAADATASEPHSQQPSEVAER